MAFKGGYQLIDLKENNFTVGGDAITITGIHGAIESNHCKPIIVTGIKVANVEIEDCPVKFIASGNNYKGVLYTSYAGTSPDVLTATEITISENDEVTITNTTITSAD